MRLSQLVAAAAAHLLISGSVAWSQVPVLGCLQEARGAYTDCVSQCRSDFTDARLACRNVNPACGVACLAGRQACFDTVNTILQTGQLPDGSTLADCSGGTDACKQALRQAKAACGAPCQPSDTVCQECVDNAQVQSFECRDTCRDSWRTNETVIAMQQACRSAFRACLGACPPVTTTTTLP